MTPRDIWRRLHVERERLGGALLLIHPCASRGCVITMGCAEQWTARGDPRPDGLAAALHDVAHYPQRAP